MRDLYEIMCPAIRAVRARIATHREWASLTAVFKLDRRTRRFAGFRLAHVCVSRLNAAWAAAIAEFPDTGIPVWFHETRSTWRVASFGKAESTPAGSIVLSLASCAGYNAGEYGA
jgi:hypothetical protein